MLSLSDALAQVQAQCAPTTDPILSPQEITDILTRQSTTSTWLPSTAYAYGQVIIPTIPMGRKYICVLPGTSGTTAPQWLIAPEFTGAVNPLAGSWWGLGVMPFIENVTATPWFFGLADNTCAWRDFGVFAGELYDIRAACYSAWMLKADKASDRIDSQISRAQRANESLTYERCVDRARRFMPLGFM